VGTDVLIPIDRGLRFFRARQYRFGHPFITELAEGTLPLDKFRFFLEQDDFYLEEYKRCLALGAAKSRNA
jgi:thiaminase/transcriptional activator TenA